MPDRRATSLALTSWANRIEEVRDLGWGGTLFRLGWEARLRLPHPGPGRLRPVEVDAAALGTRVRALFPAGERIAREVGPTIGSRDLAALAEEVTAIADGRIRCFGRWTSAFGNPPNWFRDPSTGALWPSRVPWSRALRSEAAAQGDVKFVWEAARFPHAYALARAAVFGASPVEEASSLFETHVRSFLESNPPGSGVHWYSGQEIAFRLMSWAFAASVLLNAGGAFGPDFLGTLATATGAAADHIRRHISYARHAVYNNHLLSEAVGLLLAGALLQTPESEAWWSTGLACLDEGVGRQFYEDGGYIQQSHNYQRVALQDLLWACRLLRFRGLEPPAPWRDALARSVEFLVQQQNPLDGSLPNYGANDGALPSPLSFCDFRDFRPTLQASSVVARGARLYGPGPWDEESAWLSEPDGPQPVRPVSRRSVSFAPTGFHVLRGRDPASFGVLRCGTLRDRFSQIDMLHLDVWWRGQNVLADPGTYMYNGPDRWHRHFMGTASHNTVTVDGLDQMTHFRRFKVLYRTRARLLEYEDADDWGAMAGEHYGFQRRPGRCVHRRSVVFLKDDVWIVADTVTGEGERACRIHWLAGDLAWAEDGGRLVLDTPEGSFSVSLHDATGTPLAATVRAGDDEGPRGWLSRYYGEKRPVASLAYGVRTRLPWTVISVLGEGRPTLAATSSGFRVTSARRSTELALRDGCLRLAGA